MPKNEFEQSSNNPAGLAKVASVAEDNEIGHFAQNQGRSLLRQTFSNEGGAKDDSDRALMVEVFVRAAVVTSSCKDFDTYKTWLDRLHDEWEYQASLERQDELPVNAGAALIGQQRLAEHVAEAELGVFELVVTPYLLPLWDLFPPTRYVVAPLATNHKIWIDALKKDVRMKLVANEKRWKNPSSQSRRRNGSNSSTRSKVGFSPIETSDAATEEVKSAGDDQSERRNEYMREKKRLEKMEKRLVDRSIAFFQLIEPYMLQPGDVVPPGGSRRTSAAGALFPDEIH